MARHTGGVSSANRPEFPDEHSKGRFVRQDSAFRNRVCADSGAEFPAASGRYHLYVSLACPWAHRTIIVRRLLGLEDVISMSVVDPIRDERGWAFRSGSGHGPDPVNNFEFLSEAYLATDSGLSGRITVPVLWDTQTGRIVNNESSEIIVMLNGAFDEWGDGMLDLYPELHREEIDSINARVYKNVNDGVYRSGFATTQEAYEEAVVPLFETLDGLDRRLAGRRWLVGDTVTLADVRLFTTLVRFDAVYVQHFKCNIRRIADYEHLPGYLRDLYQQPAFGETTNFDHIRRHYFLTHRSINPAGIIPAGPILDLDAPPGRDDLII